MYYTFTKKHLLFRIYTVISYLIILCKQVQVEVTVYIKTCVLKHN